MKRYIPTLILITFMAINALIAYTAPATVSAASAVPCSSNSNAICNPLNSSDITTLLTDLVNIAIPIGAVIAVIMFVYVGFKFIFAQGKSEAIKDAWKWFGCCHRHGHTPRSKGHCHHYGEHLDFGRSRSARTLADFIG